MAYSSLFIIGIIFMTYNIASSMAKAVWKNQEAESAVSIGMKQFTTDFYKEIANDKPDNLICSPISAGIVLAMTAYGARGKTETQMRSGLRLPEDLAVGKSGFQLMIDSLNSVKKVNLSIANNIFTNIDVDIKPEFKEITETSFRSAAKRVDFKNPHEASQTINSWCAEKTNNRITKIVQSDDVKEAAMVLVNAVYFKGNWENKFNPQKTVPKPFHIDETKTQDVQMMFMHNYLRAGMFPELNAQYVELPYESKDEDDAINMIIILPNEVNGLKNAENNFDKIDFKKLYNRAETREVLLYLPKFKIESTLDLQPVLEKMGMGEIFGNAADFSGIAASPPLKISKVIQKAFIEVNEEGSEAAAASAVIAVGVSALVFEPEPIRIDINRPFMYAIYHIKTNTVLFQGHITLPQTE